MLTLASMIWAAYMFCQSHTNMRSSVPPPVVIEQPHKGFSYDEIDSAITVPYPWKDSCYSQRQIILEMLYHFNNFRNGNSKMKPETMNEISRKWVCVE